MHVARFLSGLPSSFDPVKSQILGSKELPSLSEVFSRLQQASISDSTPSASNPSEKSALLTTTGGGRFSRGGHGYGRGHEQGVGGRGSRKCTY